MGGLVRAVFSVHIHPDWNVEKPESGADIALVRLSDPVSEEEDVGPSFFTMI